MVIIQLVVPVGIINNVIKEDSAKIYGKLQGVMPGITYLSVASSMDNSILNTFIIFMFMSSVILSLRALKKKKYIG